MGNAKRKDLKFETNSYIFDYQQFETIRSFSDSISNGKINIRSRDETNRCIRKCFKF